MRSCLSAGFAITSAWAILLGPSCPGAPVTSAGKAGFTTPSAAIPAFRITVVDDRTSRGIPLVRLTLTDRTDYFTDSAGVIAFLEPELMNCDVGATIESYGYSYAKDWFGAQTVRFVPTPGGSLTIALHRHNIAERLYRSTGTGIYRDSVLLGDSVPITTDPSKYAVTGIDGSEVAHYRDKLIWIRGDTGISATGLGNFKTTGATSELPGKGGLDPEVGVKLTYFRRPDGWPKAMVNMENKAPVWCGCLRVATDDNGREHLFGSYLKCGSDGQEEERGLVEFNDETRSFDKVASYDPKSPIRADGRPFRFKEDGVEYFGLFEKYAPHARMRSDIRSMRDFSSYEAFTCLKQGSRFNGKAEQLDRDAAGRLLWGWKRDTSPVVEEQDKLVKSGAMKPEEARYRLTDVRTGKVLQSHVGSVFYNQYRDRWVSIQLEEWGDSWIGEVWYFEGDTPLGPWIYGRKVITHVMRDETREEGKRMDEKVGEKEEKDTRSFYCTRSLPLFDKEGGRIIFIEGTYSATFSSAKCPTPRYDYNDVVYKLELSDPRLFLPVPIYQVKGKRPGYYSKSFLPQDAEIGDVVFYAPDQQLEGTVPVYQGGGSPHDSPKLTTDKPSPDAVPAFHALPAGGEGLTTAARGAMADLNEFVNAATGARIYSTGTAIEEPGYHRTPKPICRVWPNPLLFNPLRDMWKRIEPVVER